MSNIAGAPLLTDAEASLSKERLTELNEQYTARFAAEIVDKDAANMAKKDSKGRKSSSVGGGWLASLRSDTLSTRANETQKSWWMKTAGSCSVDGLTTSR